MIILPPAESARLQKDLALDYGRTVHFERFLPPEAVYEQCTDGMTKSVELQQTDWNTLCNWTMVLEFFPRPHGEMYEKYFITYGALCFAR